MKKICFVLLGGLMLISCGPSPESMAKKNCGLYQKLLEAEAAQDSIHMKKYLDEMMAMDKELEEKHKNNPDWITTYKLERDACIIRNLKNQ